MLSFSRKDNLHQPVNQFPAQYKSPNPDLTSFFALYEGSNPALTSQQMLTISLLVITLVSKNL